MAATRSPNYPQADLGEAIEGIRKIWNEDGKNKVAAEAAIHHLGYTSMNGAAQVSLSVLKKYGLLESKDGKVWVSDLAVDLLEGRDNPSVYRTALVKAAFLPALFQELRNDFPDSIPSPDSLRFHLIKQGFNPEAATKAAKAYRETMELVTASGATYTGDGKLDGNAGVAAVATGDLVQWESQGVLQFPTPRRVTGISEDGRFAFIEGSLSGFPVHELTRHQGEEPAMQGQSQTPPPASIPPPSTPRAPLAAPREGYKQDVFSLSEGEAVLRWPEGLSQESFEDFKGWLELVLRKIGRSVPK